MKGKIKVKRLEIKKGMYLRDKDYHGNSGWTKGSLWFWNEVKEQVGEVIKAELRQKPNRPLDCYLILYTTKDIKVVLYGVNGGYSGEGPRGTEEVLKDAGFNSKRVEEIVFSNETFVLRRRAKGVYVEKQ